ncbi:MAG: hypothetical protein LBF15_00155 [Candidatus Peribacteria bacterium]|nr:hypothetical protein [Candidatus Peribacteria bacterium]
MVVYKERAFHKFEDLINEIEYKVVKAVFSVKKIFQVEQIDLSKENLQVSGSDEAGGSNLSVKINTNPLFANPNA